jgi:hypothetical protein
MKTLGTRDLLPFPIAAVCIHLGCTDHAYDKAKRGAAPMAHLSVHKRLDNADQLNLVLSLKLSVIT